MKRLCAGLAVLLAAAAPPAKPTHTPRATAGGAQAFQVTSWLSLDDDANRTARAWVGRNSLIARPQDTATRITVYSKHRDMREQEWREDLRAAQPSYEASNSDSAGSAYTSYPEYTSPEQERLMSTVKDSLGIAAGR